MVFIRCRLLLLFLYYTFGRDIYIFAKVTEEKKKLKEERRRPEKERERGKEGEEVREGERTRVV